MNSEGITQNDRKIANSLNYDGVMFSVWEKYFNKIETKNSILIKMFCYEN